MGLEGQAGAVTLLVEKLGIIRGLDVFEVTNIIHKSCYSWNDHILKSKGEKYFKKILKHKSTKHLRHIYHDRLKFELGMSRDRVCDDED